MAHKRRKVGFVALFFLSVSYAFAGQWSQYESCDNQYAKDISVCNTLPAGTTTATKAKREACWSSAADRLATCNNSKGKTLNSPVLRK